MLGCVLDLFLDPGDVEEHATVRAAGPGFHFRELGPIQVKGRVEPVGVNEVVGLQA